MAGREEEGQGMGPGASGMKSELVSRADGSGALTVDAEWSASDF